MINPSLFTAITKKVQLLDNPMLDRLRILDFSKLLPGPFGTMIMADLGAEILQVEHPDRSDLIREIGPMYKGSSAYHLTLNRNKKSITLDLKTKQGRDRVKELIKTYDVIVEGFRPGTMKRLGLDYESLKEINPEIIYCSITGYGQKSTKQNDAGHDINYLSLAGIASHSGSIEKGPILNGIQIGDLSGSFYLVISILSSYINRLQGAGGQFIDISLTDTSMSLQLFKSIDYLVGGSIPSYNDGLLDGGGYYDFYKTKDGRYLSIGSLEGKFYRELVEAIEDPQLRQLDPAEDYKMIKQRLTTLIEQKEIDEWIEIFNDYDACVEPVLNLQEVFSHDYTQSRNVIKDLPTPTDGSIEVVSHPVKYSNFSPILSHAGVSRGRHNDEILS